MRILATILFLSIPMVAFAQNYQGVNEGGMQRMMQQMQNMQSCMQNVDQEQLKMLEQRAYQTEADVKSLCASGKRDKAQERAISFGKAISKDPTMQAMKKCGEGMEEMMPKLPFTHQGEDHSSQHVCD